MDSSEEWTRQAYYDYETAEYLFRDGRYMDVGFKCHLAVEKMMKAFLCKIKGDSPPRTHNLIWLRQETNLIFPPHLRKFISRLNEMNLGTRYPDNLERWLDLFNESLGLEILEKTKEIMEWIKQQP